MSTPETETTATRQSMEYPLWVLDLDGTVRHGRDELGRFVNAVEDVVIFETVPGLLWQHAMCGGSNVAATNQGGVALGHMSALDNERILEATNAACRVDLTLPLRDMLCCTHAPDGDCWCRKPGPGMILEAARRHGDRYGKIGRRDVLMVGDRPEDRLAAERAGVDFRLAHEWRAGA